MNILITGASGYIGSHIAYSLRNEPYNITLVDNQLTPNTGFIESVGHYHKIEIDDLRGNFDVVIHCAGLISVEESTLVPWEYYDNNFIKTKNMLNNVKCDHFIFASTAGAFDPINPYAKSKLIAEDIVKEFCRNFTIFRFYNVAGSNGLLRQNGRPTHLIRMAAMAAADKLDKLTIYGNDYKTRDKTCIRDYIHVQDVADSIIGAIPYPANTEYECLGSGKGYSNLQVVKTMQRVTRNSFKYDFGNRREGDPDKLICNTISEYCTIKNDLKKICLDQYNLEEGL